MKIKTEVLKELLSKCVQCVGDNKLIAITQMIGIKLIGNELKLISTDATNYMVVTKEVEDDGSAFNVTVYAEQFSKLISRTTSEYTYLRIVDSNLEVKGNGTYTLELPLDEEGEPIDYPNPLDNIKKIKWNKNKISVKDISVLHDTLKPALSASDDFPVITNYYVGETVIATNRNVMSSYAIRIADKDVLMSLKLVDILSIMKNDISYYIDDEKMIFMADDITVYSKWGNDVDEYPIDKLSGFMEVGFKSSCKVNKDNFIALLERISLFVGKYDNEVVRLYFEKDGIRVSNKDRMSNEVLDYVDSKGYKSYDCAINVNMLLTQLKAYSGDILEIQYNNDIALKLANDNIVQIIALTIENK